MIRLVSKARALAAAGREIAEATAGLYSLCKEIITSPQIDVEMLYAELPAKVLPRPERRRQHVLVTSEIATLSEINFEMLHSKPLASDLPPPEASQKAILIPVHAN